MRLKQFAVALALPGLSPCWPRRPMRRPRRSASSSDRGHTVFVSRDEDGRTRTKIIVQKRSYLDPGTEALPGDEHNHDYAIAPNQSRNQRARQHALRRQPDGAAGPVHAAEQEQSLAVLARRRVR